MVSIAYLAIVVFALALIGCGGRSSNSSATSATATPAPTTSSISPNTINAGAVSSSSGIAATTLYALRASPIYADAAAQRAIGSVTPGTPLHATAGASNGIQPFTLDAWSQRGNDTSIVAGQGQRIVLATLAAGVPNPKILSTVKDAYGNVWNKVELSGFVEASGLTANQSTVWAQAQTLYSTRCSVCHALHKPTEFTANQWPAILVTMEKNAALQPDQAALITQYLQTHSK